MNNIATIKS